MTTLKLTSNYFGLACKVLIKSSCVLQEEVVALEAKYPNYEIREIGYQSDHGYKYRYAAFEKGKYEEFFK